MNDQPTSSTPARIPLVRQNAERGLTHELEENNATNESNTNKSTPSTSSSTSSTSSDDSTRSPLTPQSLIEEFDQAADEAAPNDTQLSIANRIVKNHQLNLMSELPALNIDDPLLTRTTIITVNGLFQFDHEYKEFRLRLAPETLKTIGFANFLDRASDPETPIQTISLYDELTLEQLLQLEKALRDNRGRGVIGYTINEEVFLKLIGLGQHEYPPKPDTYPAQVLTWVNKPLVKEITTSLRTSAQGLILFGNLVATYLQYDTKNQTPYDDFFYKNVYIFLIIVTSIFLTEMFLLRSGFFNKELILNGINRLRLIEESMIGSLTNWIAYASLIFPNIVIKYGLLPVLLFALKQGWDDDNAPSSLINIANNTRTKTIVNALFLALTTSSFFGYGLEYFMGDIVYATISDDSQATKQFSKDCTYMQYTVCIITFLSDILRYPYASNNIQWLGRYSSNIINSLGCVMLDNYSMFVIISMIIGLMLPNGIAYNQTGLLAMFYSLQIITLFYCFITSFSSTPELPEYSIEPNPFEPNIFTLISTILSKCNNKIEAVKKCFKSENNQVSNLIQLSVFTRPRTEIILVSHTNTDSNKNTLG